MLWISRDPLVYTISLWLWASPRMIEFMALLYSAILKMSVLYTDLYQENIWRSSGKLWTRRRTFSPSAAYEGTDFTFTWTEVEGLQHLELEAGREKKSSIEEHWVGGKMATSFLNRWIHYSVLRYIVGVSILQGGGQQHDLHFLSASDVLFLLQGADSAIV